MKQLGDEFGVPLWQSKFDWCHRHACTLPSSKLAQLERHTYAVGNALVRYKKECGDHSVEGGELLCLAGGLQNVEIFTGRYEDDVLYCESAYEWEKKRSVVVSAYATDVVRFLYIYNAFQSVVSSLPMSNRALKKGAANASSSYLKLYHGPIVLPLAHYECTIESMRCNVSKSDDWNDLRGVFESEQSLAADFAAMNLAQLVRNSFVHEAFSFPPEPESPRFRHREVLRIATRMTLLTIQMLIIACVNREADADAFHDPIGLLTSAQLADQYE